MGRHSLVENDDLIAVIEALKKHGGSRAEAARALGFSTGTMHRRLRQAAKRGLGDRIPPPQDGFEISKITQQLKDGAVQKEWIQSIPEREPFELPADQVVHGISALTDAHGNLIQKWTKAERDVSFDDTKEALLEAFKEYNGAAVIPQLAAITNEELLTCYVIADHHLGLHAWEKEGDANYDLAIGEQILKDAMGELVASTPPSDVAVILSLGDFFHIDDGTNQTRKSHVHLDTDGRYAKIIKAGVNLIIYCAMLALRKHRYVIIRCLPGNHDEHAALALTIGLSCFFAHHDRVDVDDNPGRFWMHKFGRVLLTSTHGDECKPAEMPGVVASTWPEEWGATEFRYCYLGHIHHAKSDERHGLKWETFQTLAPKDAWHWNKGYRSGRSMVAVTHHCDTGEKLRHIVAVRRPKGVSHASPPALQDPNKT